VDIGVIDISKKESAVEESLRKHLKDYYNRRKRFDSSFINGDKFKYTALNIGGTGSNLYGPFCVIIKKEEAGDYNTLAFIKEDSAVNYVENRQVVLEKLARDVSNKECMYILTLLKHESEIESHSSDKWHVMICTNTNYIEAVTVDDILNSHIKCVRIDKSYFNSIYKESLIKLFYSELKENERYRLASFKRLLAEMKKQGIELEIINED
jgi:hypothetical protein